MRILHYFWSGGLDYTVVDICVLNIKECKKIDKKFKFLGSNDNKIMKHSFNYFTDKRRMKVFEI